MSEETTPVNIDEPIVGVGTEDVVSTGDEVAATTDAEVAAAEVAAAEVAAAEVAAAEAAAAEAAEAAAFEAAATAVVIAAEAEADGRKLKLLLLKAEEAAAKAEAEAEAAAKAEAEAEAAAKADAEAEALRTPVVTSATDIPPLAPIDWFAQTQFILFSGEMKNLKKGNSIILKECKEAKRLLDLKFSDLTDKINRIQTSVILFSTLSGFFNATKLQFGLTDDIISVMSISVSTYVTLVLSISKYYKFDEMKESIQVLREKYSVLHNKIEHRADVLGPWADHDLWRFADADRKLADWTVLKTDMDDEYVLLIDAKKALTTEFEVIMDTRSRNFYHIVNKKLTYDNREKLFGWAKYEMALEDRIEDAYDERDELQRQRQIQQQQRVAQMAPGTPRVITRRHTLHSDHEVMGDNWDSDSDEGTGDTCAV